MYALTFSVCVWLEGVVKAGFKCKFKEYLRHLVSYKKKIFC